MSAGNINILLDLWALNMAKYDDLGPFSSYEHMYSAIDNIKHGDAPWKSFTTSYAGELHPNAPSWQLQDYEVWFRDPDRVIRNMLDNPDFDGHFDYAPYVDLDKTGNRKWNEFLSGNYSWRHAVSPSMLRWSAIKILFKKNNFRQIYLKQMQRQKVRCIALSFSVQTKPQSPWQLEMLSTTLCTSRLGMSTTPLGVHTEMLLCR